MVPSIPAAAAGCGAACRTSRRGRDIRRSRRSVTGRRKAFNYSHLPHCRLRLLLLRCRFALPVACWVGLSSPSLVAFAIQQQQQYTSARKYCKEKEKEKSISALDPPSQLLTGPSPSYRRTFTSFSPFFFPMIDARYVLLSSFGGLGN